MRVPLGTELVEISLPEVGDYEVVT